MNNPQFISIADECFTDGDVISYKGENYYRACDHFVKDLDGGGASYCVKRVNHPGLMHEDYYGNTLIDTEDYHRNTRDDSEDGR